MGKINIRKEPDGWRAYIIDDGKVTVLDNFFEDEIDAAQAALSLNS